MSVMAYPRGLRWGRFVSSRVHEIGLARSSIHTLQLELGAWYRWLDERGKRWTEITPADLRLWLDQIDTLAPATFIKKRWAVQSLYSWAAREGIVRESPWNKVPTTSRKVTRFPRYVPTVHAVEALLKRPDLHSMIGIRDRAILELLYAAGLRAAELVDLTYEQMSVGANQRAIRVIGKGRRERIVIYGERAAVWLSFYATIARRQLLARATPTNQYFVSNSRSGTFSYTTLRRLVRCYARDVGLPQLTAHSLRHAFATHLYQNGARLETIQMLLGHASAETTAIYARPSVEHLRHLVARHHPRGLMYQSYRRYVRGNEQPVRPALAETNVSGVTGSGVPQPLFKTDGPQPLFG